MRWARLDVLVTVTIVTLCTAALTLTACAARQPALHTNVDDGARDVPLSTSLEVTAVNARLEQAMLERVDVPAAPVELTVTDSGARLPSGLEPDARYRLVASAEPDRATPLPWVSPSAKLLVERVFDTVHTPVLLDTDAPLLVKRGEPLTLRFSEPLAQIRAESTGAAAEARIAKDDPHLVQLDLKNPRPGDELPIRLLGLKGANGVTAPEQTIVVETPDPSRLVSVNGSDGDHITLPPNASVLLEWARPVTSVRYRVGDTRATSWKGSPTTDVELPIQLAPGESETLTIEDAETPDGGWLATAQTLELAGTAPLQLAAFWPADGATGIAPTGDPTFRFSEPIVDRAAAEAAITFDPAVPGRFEWLAPNRVHFLPTGSFPRESEIAMTVSGGPQGVRGASGAFLADSFTSTFSTGKDKRIDVSLSRQVLTLYENDTAVWSAPVATGVKGAETPPGTYKVEYKMPVARFVGVNPGGSRYDIPDVHWVLAFYGDYTIHGAYWRTTFGRPGSNGCISLTDANARYVFYWADEGTPVVVRG